MMINSKDLQILPIKELKQFLQNGITAKVFDLENKMIFSKSWHLVGSEGILKSPGDAVIKKF